MHCDRLLHALHSDWQFWNVFTDVKTIGKGHLAKVKQVAHQESQEQFAAKILDKSLADNDIEDLVREFQMLRALRHNNIIRLYAAYETPRKLYLVTELSTGGELMKRLEQTQAAVVRHKPAAQAAAGACDEEKEKKRKRLCSRSKELSSATSKRR